MAPAATSSAEAVERARYAALLESALDAYEQELRAASTRWYVTHAEAYAVSRRFTEPDVSRLVARALAAHGVEAAELERYARDNPDFVRDQNALFRERMHALRPEAFAVMGRIDASRARRELAPAPEDAVRASLAVQAHARPVLSGLTLERDPTIEN